MRALFTRLGAAAAIAMGAAFNDIGMVPTIGKGKHRHTADSKAGRQMVSRKHRSTNKYAGQVEDPRFSQACARRRAQQARYTRQNADQFYTPERMQRMYGPGPEVYVRPPKAWPPRG
jgi:hypothetical protein